MAQVAAEELYIPVSRRLSRGLSTLWKITASLAAGALITPWITKIAEAGNLLGGNDPWANAIASLGAVAGSPWIAWGVGILGGSSLTFLCVRWLIDHDRFDATKLRLPAQTLAEIKARFPDSPVAGVPDVEWLHDRADVTTSPAFEEAMHSLRTLLRARRSHAAGCRKLLVTSSRGNEGKSSIALGIARSIASVGETVLLVDADLRMFGLTRALGAAVHAGVGPAPNLDARSHVLQIGDHASGVDFLPSGPKPLCPATLLEQLERARFWPKVGDGYDWLVLDGPPVLGLADAVTLARDTEEVIYVVEAGETPLRAVASSLDRIMVPAEKLIFVLSKTSKMFSQFSFGFDPVASVGYGYSYAYGYGPPRPRPHTPVIPPAELTPRRLGIETLSLILSRWFLAAVIVIMAMEAIIIKLMTEPGKSSVAWSAVVLAMTLLLMGAGVATSLWADTKGAARPAPDNNAGENPGAGTG